MPENNGQQEKIQVILNYNIRVVESADGNHLIRIDFTSPMISTSIVLPAKGAQELGADIAKTAREASLGLTIVEG